MVTPPLAKTPQPLQAVTAAKLPTQPSATLKDSDLVDPSKPVTQPAAETTTDVVPKKSLLMLVVEHFVQVDDLRNSGAHYPWRGVCKKCGWHTHQFNQEDAFVLTRSHAQIHWRDVQRFM